MAPELNKTTDAMYYYDVAKANSDDVMSKEKNGSADMMDEEKTHSSHVEERDEVVHKTSSDDVMNDDDKNADSADRMTEEQFVPPPTVLSTLSADYLYKTTCSFPYSCPQTLTLTSNMISRRRVLPPCALDTIGICNWEYVDPNQCYFSNDITSNTFTNDFFNSPEQVLLNISSINHSTIGICNWEYVDPNQCYFSNDITSNTFTNDFFNSPEQVLLNISSINHSSNVCLAKNVPFIIDNDLSGTHNDSMVAVIMFTEKNDSLSHNSTTYFMNLVLFRCQFPILKKYATSFKDNCDMEISRYFNQSNTTVPTRLMSEILEWSGLLSVFVSYYCSIMK